MAQFSIAFFQLDAVEKRSGGRLLAAAVPKTLKNSISSLGSFNIVTVYVNGDLDFALKRLRKAISLEGMVRDLTRYQQLKKSERLRSKHDRAIRRRKKLGIN